MGTQVSQGWIKCARRISLRHTAGRRSLDLLSLRWGIL